MAWSRSQIGMSHAYFLRDEACAEGLGFGEDSMFRKISGTRQFAVGFVVVALLVLIALSTTPAYADDLSYSTSGCFTGSVCSGGNSTASIYDLFVTTQVDSTIVFTGASGFASIGEDYVNLGALTFNAPSPSNAAGLYNGFFSLGLSISGFGQNSFTALMSGDVLGNAGGATLTFDPINEVFTDGDADYLDVTLDVNPIQVSTNNPTAEITAYFGGDPGGSSDDVPEPATILLSGVGFAGLFLLRRRLALA